MESTHPNAAPLTAEIHNFLNTLIDYGGFDLETTVTVPEADEILVVFSGDDVALLLGHSADLLNTLEYLASRAFSKHLGHIRLKFDASGYRSSREHELRMMAETAAARVKRSGKSFTFNPMPPSERRIIHTALSNDNEVRTESVGDGDERKLVIHPASHQH